MSDEQVAVAVPVRNEAHRLPMLLDALARQKHAPPFAVCLFFDNCTDASRELAVTRAAGGPFALHTGEDRSGRSPNVGIARREALALALGVAPEGTLLTTDADSAPAENWIGASLAALDHADIVAGRIAPHGRASPRQMRVGRYFDRLHGLRRLLDPVEWEAPLTHHWTSAASLAMSAATYRRIGGVPPIARGEDAAMLDTAARLGLRTRRDATVRVRTSTRRQGRVHGGFASSLTTGDAARSLPAVAHPEDEAWRYAHQAMARRFYRGGDATMLAASLSLPTEEVRQVAAECRNGEAFAARIVGTPPGGMRHVALDQAEDLLARLEQGLLKGAA